MDAKAPLRAAVFYYGSAPVPTLRADLPVLSVMAGHDAPSLNEGIRKLWTTAALQPAPWTMVSAPTLPHAFDALVENETSTRLVRHTVEFLVNSLRHPETPPEVPPARQALAYSYGAQWPEAAAAYGAIVAADPQDREARRQYGRALMRSGRGADAVRELRQVIAQGEDGAGVHLDLANLLLADKQYAAAVAEFDAAIARGGPAGVGHYNAACALALGGQADAALDRLEKAVAAGFGSRSQYTGDADLASLRTHARWPAILARLPE
jgi:hypothetical protein